MRGTFISGGGARVGLLLRAMMLSSALVGAAMLPVHAQAQTAERQFDIPAQSLGDALMAFGRQSGMQVTAEAPLIEGRNSSAVSGRMAAGQALSQLLAGSGLTFRYAGRNAVRLERAPQAADGAIQLGPVRVEGANDAGNSSFAYSSDPAATEGTGTYAAQTVTMFKGAKSLRDIPQSVSVMTREQMDDQGFARTEDALSHMAGVRLDGFPDTRNINVRGFKAGEQLDGVPMLATGFSMDPAIYDRIELVRSPSGLLTGSGEPGGSVNYVRKRPLDRFAVGANLAGGSWKLGKPRCDPERAILCSPHYRMACGYDGPSRLRGPPNFALPVRNRSAQRTASTKSAPPLSSVDRDPCLRCARHGFPVNGINRPEHRMPDGSRQQKESDMTDPISNDDYALWADGTCATIGEVRSGHYTHMSDDYEIISWTDTARLIEIDAVDP